jgi:hypothetical protein
MNWRLNLGRADPFHLEQAASLAWVTCYSVETSADRLSELNVRAEALFRQVVTDD